MKLPISPRLLVCAGFVSPGERVADVGCDHGYLSIYLLTHGIARSVIASDIHEAPLKSARLNAEKYGVGEKMQFFLSDGVKDIPRDFDVLICAGMGTDTMISILEAAPWLKKDSYRLILQCQSKTPVLRRYLSQQGWRITEESVLKDGRFLYTVMEVYWEPTYPKLTPGQWHFPPAMIENPSGETAQYYRRTIKKLQISIAGRKENADPLELLALEELTADPLLAFMREDKP